MAWQVGGDAAGQSSGRLPAAACSPWLLDGLSWCPWNAWKSSFHSFLLLRRYVSNTQSQARRGDVTVTPMHDFLRHPSGAPFWQFCPPSATKPTLHFFFYIICSRVFILFIHLRKYENVAIADLAGISNRIKTLSQEIAAYICRPCLWKLHSAHSCILTYAFPSNSKNIL